MIRSAYDRLGGIVWIPRMLDKIRLNKKGVLPDEYKAHLGIGFDDRCLRFLGIKYQDLVDRTLQGGDDGEILEWILRNGRKPSEDEILMWNDFLSKRGWRNSDGDPDALQRYKKKYGLGHRDDILTYFDFFEVDEGRKA